MAEIAGILTPVRMQLLETCKEWTEMKDICARMGKSRTTCIHNVEILLRAKLLKETTINFMRTRKKLYKTIPFKVEVGTHGNGSSKMDITEVTRADSPD